MTEAAKTPEEVRPDLSPMVRYYLFAACIGLLVLWLALFERGLELFSLIPVLFGAMGLAPSLLPPRWRGLRIVRKMPVQYLPLFAVFTMVPLEVLFTFGRIHQSDFFRLSDLLLTAGLLSYLVPQYRLIGLRTNLVPIDERARADRLSGDEPETRPIEHARVGELKHLLWIVPVCMIAGQLLWRWLISSEEWNVGGTGRARLDLGLVWWRLVILAWLLIVTGLCLAGALAILRIYRMTMAEAAMSAQETIWNETRGEQRRVHRWLAWLHRKKARETGLLP